MAVSLLTLLAILQHPLIQAIQVRTAVSLWYSDDRNDEEGYVLAAGQHLSPYPVKPLASCSSSEQKPVHVTESMLSCMSQMSAVPTTTHVNQESCCSQARCPYTAYVMIAGHHMLHVCCTVDPGISGTAGWHHWLVCRGLQKRPRSAPPHSSRICRGTAADTDPETNSIRIYYSMPLISITQRFSRWNSSSAAWQTNS